MNTTQAQANVRAAETELARLRQVATAAARESTQAHAAFEAEPSEQAYTTAKVAEQRAKNARGQAERYAQTELAQAQEALKAAQTQSIEASLQAAESAVIRKFDAAAESLLRTVEQFLDAKEEAANFAVTRRNALEAGVRSSFSVKELLQSHQQRLNDTLGVMRASSVPSVAHPETPVFIDVDGNHAIRFKALVGFRVVASTQSAGHANDNDKSSARFDA